MIDYSQKPSQFELFPGEASGSAEIGRPRSPLKDLTISPENMIVWTIVLVMTFVLAFSFGVERGKGVTSVHLTDKKINFEDKEQNAIIVPSLPAAAEKALKVKDKVVISKEDKKPASGQYTIQVASFKLKDHANKEARQLEKTGHEIFVLSKGNYSIVCVGKFEQKEQADKFSKKLKGRYRDLMLRRL